MKSKRIGTGLTMLSLLLISILVPTCSVQGLRYDGDVNLSEADASFVGSYFEQRTGQYLDIVGDINGDGYEDFIIATSVQTTGNGRSGNLWIFFGGATGWSRNVDLWDADASLVGGDWDDQADLTVSRAGDVNGDGLDDFIIGVPNNNEGFIAAGKVYVFFGRTSGWRFGMKLYEANASFRGEAEADRAGSWVACAGDVNGDGLSDILTSTPSNDEASNSAGQCYLILGKRTGWQANVSLSNVDASFTGERPSAYVFRVAGVGDVNGDRYDDFLVGAFLDTENGNNAGQAYLILGRPTGWSMDTSLADANASFLGVSAGDQASYGLGGGVDLNGDGLDDFLIGSYLADINPGNDEGKVYIFFGKRTGWQMDTLLDTADVTLENTYSNENAGTNIRGVGDVNGDGLGDVLIASPRYGAGPNAAGRVFLILGKTTGWTQKMGPDDADVIFYGEGVTALAGVGLGGGGDVDGDGFDDILIGSPSLSTNAQSDGKAYLIFPDRNTALSTVGNVTLYSDEACTQPISSAKPNDTVFVKLMGTGGNASRQDVSEVTVTSNLSAPLGFRLRLHETDVDSHTFLGSFKLSNRTNSDYSWISTGLGETVKVSSVRDPTKYALLYVTDRPQLLERPTMLYFDEDAALSYQFKAKTVPVDVWTLRTNATWVAWDAANATIAGTPTNAHVGYYWALVNVSDGLGNGDEVNVTLVVNNTPPSILTDDITVADEDDLYVVYYASDDDGQGIVTWHLTTDAGWLSLGPATGVLSGTPSNDDVGTHLVNVSVDDGNGGWDFHNFTLTVLNVPDPPVLFPPMPPAATEDVPYSFGLEALDPDHGDSFTWSMRTVAGWLRLDGATGVLSGTPTNDDVGDAYLDITVTDSTGRTASLGLKIQVINVNDPPWITTVDVTTATEDVAYRVVYAAADVDAGEILTWSFDRNASWLSFDPTTDVLSGLPTNEDVGVYFVNLTVTDSSGEADVHNFTLTVLNVNDAPRIESTSPPTAARVGEEYSYQVVASDVDVGDVLRYSLETRPQGMTVNASTGLIIWTPQTFQVGNHSVAVQLTDGEAVARQAFVVTVSPAAPNTDPWFTSKPPTDPIRVNTTFIYQLTAADAEDYDRLTFELVQGPEGMEINTTTRVLKWTPGPGDVGTHKVVVRVSDGRGGTSEQPFNLTVKEVDDGEMVIADGWYLPLLLLLLFLVAIGALIAVAVRRTRAIAARARPTVIDDVFLVHRDGRLIHHQTRRLRPDVDDQALTGMLTTVQSIVKGSVGGAKERAVNDLRYGNGRVLVEHGEAVYLALFITGGSSDDLHASMREVVEEIELEHFPALSEWDGDPGSVKGLGRHLDRLIHAPGEERPEQPSRPAREPPRDVKGRTTPLEEVVVERAGTPVIQAPVEPVEQRPPPPPPPPPPPVPSPPVPPSQSPMDDAERATAREHREVMKVLTQLPQGMPTSLWGWDMAELARAIVDGEKRKASDGTPLVRVKERWYIVDRSNLGTFLREWDEGGPDTPMERRKKLKQLEKALLEGKISEKTYEELKGKYES